MADKKNNEPLDLESSGAGKPFEAPPESNVASKTEKLKATHEGLNRASAESKARKSSIDKRHAQNEKESRRRMEAAAKRREEAEKRNKELADAKLAEYDYAHSYRKKLMKDQVNRLEEEKLREREAREARLSEEREARMSARQAELDDVERRRARADSVLEDVLGRGGVNIPEGEEPDRLQNAEEIQSSVKKGLQSAISAAEGLDDSEVGAGDEVRISAEDVSSAASDAVGDVIAVDFEAVATDADGNAVKLGGDEPSADEGDVLELDFEAVAVDEDGHKLGNVTAGDDGVIETPPEKEKDIIELEFEAEDVSSESEEDFEMAFDESGNLTINHKPKAKSEGDVLHLDPDTVSVSFDETNPFTEESVSQITGDPSTQMNEEDLEAFRERLAKAYEKKRAQYLKDKRRTSEEELRGRDNLIHDEIVEVIKAEGEKLVKYDISIKEYLKHSKDAIKNFRRAVKAAEKTLKVNCDECESPMLIAEVIKIYGKILEIRSNNLENLVKIKAHSHIREVRMALHEDIDDYNEYVIMYSALTGEQLTRVSTFLPENIAEGKALAVIPVLSYKDSYVQEYPDESGGIKKGDGSATTPIRPMLTAEMLFTRFKAPHTKLGCAIYRMRAVRAIRRLNGAFNTLGRMITETNLAERKYENEIKRLALRTPASELDSGEYQKKVFRINIKYGKLLTSISTAKTKNAFRRTKLRLLIGKLTVEREKLVVAYELLRRVYRYGKFSQRKFAERLFVGVMYSYNKCAELCSKVTGTEFAQIPSSVVEQVCRGEDQVVFPIVAYRRELVETVGEKTRVISTALRQNVTPEEEVYYEGAQIMFGKSALIRDASAFLTEDAMDDRASAVSKVLVDSMRDLADSTKTMSEYRLYCERSRRVLKYYKRALRRSERAMSRAFDENGVVTALVENLRLLATVIEIRRINVALASRMNRNDTASSESKALYRVIELFNGRAIDYTSIVGEQFSRISIMTPSVLVQSSESIRIPTITYKDNYIEVFPKNPLDSISFENPVQRKAGVYTPLLMQHFRLTENRAVETTVINSPFIFDVHIDEVPVRSWWHPTFWWEYLGLIFQPIWAWFNRITKVNFDAFVIDESLIFTRDSLKERQDKNKRRHQKYELRMKMLNEEHRARLMSLETVVHDSDRNTVSYQKKLYKINARFSRKIFKLKLKWMEGCPGRNETRLLLERLVVERERISGLNKILIKYRNYGRITLFRNVLQRYKKRFLNALASHNETSKLLSENVGTQFSEVSTSVAEEVIRNGNMIKFPQIVCCREVIETVDGVARTIGDRWHGFGLYTGTSGTAAGSGGAPVMSVGAMGYSTDMGVPYLKADFDGMTMLGMTKGGVPLIGFAGGGGKGTSSMRAGTDTPIMNDTVPLSGLPLVEYPGVEGPIIPFMGVPMMLEGKDSSPVLEAGLYGDNVPMIGAVSVSNPYSGVNSRVIDSNYIDAEEEMAKTGISVETPIDITTKMIDEHFIRSLRARSMTMKGGVGAWWKLVGSEINAFILRSLTIKRTPFLSVLLPEDDEFLENVNKKVHPKEEILLTKIARLASVIDLETKRLYSASKTGIRRSQRVFSRRLLRDIDKYNNYVREYNALYVDGKEDEINLISDPRESDSENILRSQTLLEEGDESRFETEEKPKAIPRSTKPLNEWIDTLSLNIPDEIIQRVDDRPESPPRFSYRNRVLLDEESVPFTTDRMIQPLYKYAKDYFNWVQKSLVKFWIHIEFGSSTTLDDGANVLQDKNHKLGFAGRRVMNIVRRVISKRARITRRRRKNNEGRFYHIRLEKARNMKLYNKRLLRAIGFANDPINYQTKVNKALRKYLARNFRIDYNMRIRQLIYRIMHVDKIFYWIVEGILLILMALSMILSPYSALMWTVLKISVIWAFIPLALCALKFVYSLILWIAGIFLYFKNHQMQIVGAKQVEQNRNGLILDCFITEQYKLLAVAEHFRRCSNKKKWRNLLVKTVNEYNSQIGKYSDILRIPISKIEITRLSEKLMSDKPLPITEIQNFLYARELIETVDKYKTGQKLSEREFLNLINELNKRIDKLQLPENMEDGDLLTFNNLAGKIRDLGYWISNESNPTPHERYRYKRDLYRVVEELRMGGKLTDVEADAFCGDAFKVVDYLGGRPRKRIIRVLAKDDMIIGKPSKADAKKRRKQKSKV